MRRSAGLALVTLGLLGACGGADAPAAAPPAIDTSTMEVPVARLLRERRAAVVANPRDAARWAALGFALDAHRFVDEAELCLAEAVRLDPGGFDHVYQYAFLGGLTGSPPEDVLARYDAAIALRPTYPAVHLRRGDILLEVGRPLEALASFDRTLDLDPEHARAALGAGRALIAAGRAPEAVERFTALRRQVPRSRDVAVALAQALTSAGQPDEAREITESLEELDSRSLPQRDPVRARVLQLTTTVAVNYNRAIAAAERGDQARAVELMQRVLEGAPDEPRFRVEFALLHARGRRPDEGLRVLAPLLAAADPFPPALEVGGQLRVEIGQAADGLALLDRARGAGPLGLASMHARASALGALGRWGEAAGQFLEAADAAPAPAEFHALAGLALLQAGRRDEAVQQLSRAEALDAAHTMTAQLRAQLGR